MVRRTLAAFLVLFTLTQCSNKCDPSDPASWDASCGSRPGYGGGNNAGNNGGNNNGNGGPIITTTTYPTVPASVSVTGTYASGSPTITGVSGVDTLIFSATIQNHAFNPSLSDVGTNQIRLANAQSFQFLSPTVSGCTLPNGFGYPTRGGNNTMQVFTNASAACQDLLIKMKTDGFQVQFTNVPTDLGGTIGTVTYGVSP